jgi:hypothetical protein
MSSTVTTGRRKPITPAQPKRITPRSGPVERINSTSKPIVKPVEADVVTSADIVTDVLNAYNFQYVLATLKIADIDRKQSELNQARISKPIDEDQVVMYAEAMERGDKFPPIVVYQQGSTYIVMDGNHRVAAADMTKDETTIQAYVVKDPAAAQVQAFTYEANTKHGLPTSLQDRLRQAIHLINRGSHTAVQAARQLGIPLNTLRSALDQYQADKRFEALGVKKFQSLTSTAKRRLDSIHSDPVLRASAELVLDAGIGSEDVTRIVRDVNALRSEREQLAYISKERESRAGIIKATAGGRMPVPQPLVTLARMTSTLNRMDVSDLLKSLHEMPSDVRREHARAASESVTRLMAIVRDIAQDGQA